MLGRAPREEDRARLAGLFCDPEFMVYYPEALTEAKAHERFEHMVAICARVPFGKQPIVERSSGLIVGYTGVDYIDFERVTWLEWGYRLTPETRGRGYATEASLALLARARRSHAGRSAGDHPPGQPGVPERERQARVRVLEAGAGGRRAAQPVPAPARAGRGLIMGAQD